MQTTILFTSLFGMAAIIIIFIRAVSSSATAADSEATFDPEHRRSRLMWGLLVFGVIVTAASLWRWPHDAHASSASVAVNVTGGQWYWEIDKETLPVGTPVIFNVRTKDVNHGMGVYTAAGQLIFQIQGMPGYTNQVKYVFDKPGEYKILCMEFCGIAHHDMKSEFTVVADG